MGKRRVEREERLKEGKNRGRKEGRKEVSTKLSLRPGKQEINRDGDINDKRNWNRWHFQTLAFIRNYMQTIVLYGVIWHNFLHF